MRGEGKYPDTGPEKEMTPDQTAAINHVQREVSILLQDNDPVLRLMLQYFLLRRACLRTHFSHKYSDCDICAAMAPATTRQLIEWVTSEILEGEYDNKRTD